jgi:hypothetical protein
MMIQMDAWMEVGLMDRGIVIWNWLDKTLDYTEWIDR